jgi:endonuclease III
LLILRDNAGLTKFKNLDKIPIHVDIHITRTTLSLGIVNGHFDGHREDLFEFIREAWSESVRGLQVHGRPMIAPGVDEPLWHLSKYGCNRREPITGNCPMQRTCEAREFCIPEKIQVPNGMADLKT